jgi:hypothetical protein
MLASGTLGLFAKSSGFLRSLIGNDTGAIAASKSAPLHYKVFYGLSKRRCAVRNQPVETLKRLCFGVKNIMKVFKSCQYAFATKVTVAPLPMTVILMVNL